MSVIDTEGGGGGAGSMCPLWLGYSCIYCLMACVVSEVACRVFFTSTVEVLGLVFFASLAVNYL